MRRELLVGLVDDHYAPGSLIHRFDDVESERRAGGVVGRAEDDHVRLGGPHLLGRLLRSDGVVGLTRTGDPPRTGALRDERVHRIGRREPESRATRASEGLQDVLEHLIGPVARPDLLGDETVAQVLRERLAKRGELTIRVAVDITDRDGDVIEDVARHRIGDRMRVLIHVERDGKRRLWSTVWLQSAEIVT